MTAELARELLVLVLVLLATAQVSRPEARRCEDWVESCRLRVLAEAMLRVLCDLRGIRLLPLHHAVKT